MVGPSLLQSWEPVRPVRLPHFPQTCVAAQRALLHTMRFAGHVGHVAMLWYG
jgi:hypothetical protein